MKSPRQANFNSVRKRKNGGKNCCINDNFREIHRIYAYVQPVYALKYDEVGNVAPGGRQDRCKQTRWKDGIAHKRKRFMYQKKEWGSHRETQGRICII